MRETKVSAQIQPIRGCGADTEPVEDSDTDSPMPGTVKMILKGINDASDYFFLAKLKQQTAHTVQHKIHLPFPLPGTCLARSLATNAGNRNT